MTRQDLKARVQSVIEESTGEAHELVDKVLTVIDEYCDERTKDAQEIAEMLRSTE